MSFSDSLRQQAAWVREALDPSTPETQRITLDDIDVDELEAAADEIVRLQVQLDKAKGIIRDFLPAAVPDDAKKRAVAFLTQGLLGSK